MRTSPHKAITSRLPLDLYSELKRDADAEYRTLNSTIELALRKYLSEKEAQHGNAPSVSASGGCQSGL